MAIKDPFSLEILERFFEKKGEFESKMSNIVTEGLKNIEQSSEEQAKELDDQIKRLKDGD